MSGLEFFEIIFSGWELLKGGAYRVHARHHAADLTRIARLEGWRFARVAPHVPPDPRRAHKRGNRYGSRIAQVERGLSTPPYPMAKMCLRGLSRWRPCKVSLVDQVRRPAAGPEPRLVAPLNARPLTAAGAGGKATTGLTPTITGNLWRIKAALTAPECADRGCTASPKMGKGAGPHSHKARTGY
jgi:hypothetical protein